MAITLTTFGFTGPQISGQSQLQISFGLAVCTVLTGCDSLFTLPALNLGLLKSQAIFLATKTCFPATATVQLANGSTVEMQALQTGDKVHVGTGEYSEVFMWSHRYPEAVNSFVQIAIMSGTAVTLSSGHYLYVNGVLATAGSVQNGDQLTTASGTKSTVVSIKMVTATGLFNPHTLHGDIIVVSRTVYFTIFCIKICPCLLYMYVYIYIYIYIYIHIYTYIYIYIYNAGLGLVSTH